MPMFLHTVLGWLILIILWHIWIKHHFYTQKNLEDIEDEVNEWIDKI
ncbi:MAG: hypothetical protein NTX86_02780 [Candidatus Dependentiae bacterium]|nr:hypothetical protein [Candidatus Dependentiae bacterium]